LAKTTIVQSSRLLQREHQAGKIEVPVIELQGSDGPTLTIIAGLHGCEFAGIEATRRLLADTDFTQLHGRLRVVPVANLPSFFHRSEAVVPIDNKNPNRVFPGDAGGSYTESLADLITKDIIQGSDALLDTHGGDIFELLVPYSGLASAGAEDTRARALELAKVYDLPYVLKSERLPDRVEGLGPLREAALNLGVPAVLHEAGGQGLMRETDIETHIRGMRNTLFFLGLLPGEPDIRHEQKFLETDFWRTKTAGSFYPLCKLCEPVRGGQTVGLIRDVFGEVIDEIVAPYDAEIIAIVTSLSCRENGVLYQVAH
jgi:predicted deacylase